MSKRTKDSKNDGFDDAQEAHTPKKPKTDEDLEGILATFYTALSPEELSEVFPEGCNTPEAFALRAKAAMISAGVCSSDQEVTPKLVLEFVLKTRDLPEYAPGRGHKRAALMHCLALLVASAKANSSRELTGPMLRMITESFPPRHRAMFWLCLRGTSKEVEWNKDAGMELKFKIGKISSKERKWALIKWAPIRGDSKGKKSEAEDVPGYGGEGLGFD